MSLHSNTTLNGQEILTLGMDSDTLADISCSDGDVPKWDGVAGEWYCGLDNDTVNGTRSRELCDQSSNRPRRKYDHWRREYRNTHYRSRL